MISFDRIPDYLEGIVAKEKKSSNGYEQVPSEAVVVDLTADVGRGGGVEEREGRGGEK